MIFCEMINCTCFASGEQVSIRHPAKILDLYFNVLEARYKLTRWNRAHYICVIIVTIVCERAILNIEGVIIDSLLFLSITQETDLRQRFY